MPSSPCLAAALSYARAGFSIFPVPRGTKMSHKSARFHAGRWGATKNLEEVERDFTRWPAANIGIPTGHDNGFWVVECDTVAHGVDGAAQLKKLTDIYGEFPLTRQVLSPSGSRHYYFIHPLNQIIKNDTGRKLGPGIDIRAEGGMVVVPPSQRDDGEYVFANDAKIVAAPPWLLNMVCGFNVARTRHDDDDQLVHADLVAAAMVYVPTKLTWHERNNIGMAVWAATGGSQAGFVIWDNWLRRSGRYNARATQARWAAMGHSPPNNIGYGTLAFLATKANPEWLKALDKKLIADMNAGNAQWEEYHAGNR